MKKKKKPTYTKVELKKFRELLLKKREILNGCVLKMEDEALKATDQDFSVDHMADYGSDNFEQEFTLSLMQSEGGTLEKIEAALERIEDATYGECEECGVRIPKQRLNAVPYATMCVKCASQFEQGL